MSFLRFVCKFLLVEKIGQKVGCLLFVVGCGKLNRTNFVQPGRIWLSVCRACYARLQKSWNNDTIIY